MLWFPGKGTAQASEQKLAMAKLPKPEISVHEQELPQISSGSVYQTVDPQITQKLIRLLDETSLQNILPPQDSSLAELSSFETPEGLQLSARYKNLGILLAETLAWEPFNKIGIKNAQFFKQRFLTLVRFNHDLTLRSMALVSLAALKNKEDLFYDKEALLSKETGIRFAGIEALEKCGLAEAIPILKDAAQRDGSPLLRVIATGALARIGDSGGLEILRETLKDSDWLIRALSAKALGEAGTAPDYDLLLSQLNQEQVIPSNQFVVAEILISAIKLFPKTLDPSNDNPGVSPAPQDQKRSSAYGSIESGLKPLALTAPRMNIPIGELMDPRIDSTLSKLIRENANMIIPQNEIGQSATYPQLSEFATLTGSLLKVRYTLLGTLLTEATAGTNDPKLVDQLNQMARSGRGAAVRSYALLALAYSKDQNQLTVFEDALRSPLSSDRFAAVNGLQIAGVPEAVSILNGVIKLDPSPVLRVYTAQAVLRLGDPLGKEVLFRALDDPNWVVRAIAFRYLGELGTAEDYSKVLSYLASEQNDFLTVEMCSSLLHLYSKRPKE